MVNELFGCTIIAHMLHLSYSIIKYSILLLAHDK